MTKKTETFDPIVELETPPTEGQGFGDFLTGPWEPDGALNSLKLQFLNLLLYPQSVNADELKSLFNSLTETQKESFANIAARFVQAAGDDSVVPMLIMVPKTTLDTPAGVVRVPTSALTVEAKTIRRADGTTRTRRYREKMSEEERVIQRAKDAERKRKARQKIM